MLWPMTRRAALVLAAWLAASLPLLAGSTLTRLVPADAGLCLTLEDAATHADRFLASPLFARLREYPPLAEWRREHGTPLKRIAGDVSRQLGVEVDDAWRRAFGRQTVLAVWPPAADQKEGPGLLLVEADDAELLSRLVAGIRSAQAALRRLARLAARCLSRPGIRRAAGQARSGRDARLPGRAGPRRRAGQPGGADPARARSAPHTRRGRPAAGATAGLSGSTLRRWIPPLPRSCS